MSRIFFPREIDLHRPIPPELARLRMGAIDPLWIGAMGEVLAANGCGSVARVRENRPDETPPVHGLAAKSYRFWRYTAHVHMCTLHAEFAVQRNGSPPDDATVECAFACSSPGDKIGYHIRTYPFHELRIHPFEMDIMAWL